MSSEYRRKSKEEKLLFENKKLKELIEDRLQFKETLNVNPKTKNDIKRLETCEIIRSYIKKDGSTKKDILNGFKTNLRKINENTLKRYLSDMVNSPIPYLRKEGKARATKYYIEIFSSPNKDDIKNEWNKCIDFLMKTKDIEDIEEYGKHLTSLYKWIRLLAKNGNNSILLMKQKQYLPKPKTKKRSDLLKLLKLK